MSATARIFLRDTRAEKICMRPSFHELMAAPLLRCRFTPSLIDARAIGAMPRGPLGPCRLWRPRECRPLHVGEGQVYRRRPSVSFSLPACGGGSGRGVSTTSIALH